MSAFSSKIPRIEFGVGKISQLPELVKLLGQRAFVAMDPYLLEDSGFQEILKALERNSISVVRYSGIAPNPSCFGVDEAAAIAKKEGCTVVVAIGGGSAMDVGKGVAVMATHAGECWRYTERKDHVVLRPTPETLPIIAIPTTSGTGSETTPYAVFNNPKIHEKSTIVSDLVLPKLALIDPQFTCSAPPKLTAFTGIDALAHAIESYIGLNANPTSRLVSLEAVRLVARYLPVAVANGRNLEAREKMAWASTLGGIGIAHGGVALPHALGQPVSGITGAAHGASIAACLAKIVEMSYVADIEGFAAIAEAMEPSLAPLSSREKAERCGSLIVRLLKDTDCEIGFGALGLKKEDIKKATDIALTGYYFDVESNPRRVNREQIEKIYIDCL
ncbi:MAG: iron-containing alcohol dehydrogenase [Rectinemataceae bacterium]|jgi:alcohol dehydrogenase class IV